MIDKYFVSAKELKKIVAHEGDRDISYSRALVTVPKCL